MINNRELLERNKKKQSIERKNLLLREVDFLQDASKKDCNKEEIESKIQV